MEEQELQLQQTRVRLQIQVDTIEEEKAREELQRELKQLERSQVRRFSESSWDQFVEAQEVPGDRCGKDGTGQTRLGEAVFRWAKDDPLVQMRLLDRLAPQLVELWASQASQGPGWSQQSQVGPYFAGSS